MCGIVGYIGKRQAFPIVINGLKRLEYRGYDSAGIALWNNKPFVYKSKGRVSDLEKLVENRNVEANIAFGHTRWATHGEPNDINAHPHVSMNGKFILIHNGIIENYPRLKKRLEDRGYVFKSDTDTEVLVNLIEYVYIKGEVDAETAIRLALNKIIGTYGLVVFCTDEPDKLIVARKSSPLVIGIGSGEYFIASDATPIVEHTNSVIYLNDNDMAVIKSNELQLKTIQNEELTPIIQKLDLDIGDIDKMGFDHFMLKEIFEQPRSIMDTLRGRIAPDNTDIRLGGLFAVMDELVNARRILIIGCGTSWHAGLVGEYLIEDLARISVEVEYASEFRYRDPILYPDDVIIAISQSGETADTLAAIRMAREKGITVLGICNVVGSSISRETDAGVYTHVGPEIGVASTKAFTAQVAVLTMMALIIGHKKKTISTEQFNEMVDELRNVPNIIEEILQRNDDIRKIAEHYKDATNSIYLGRGYLFPIALEGALKLKEISYIHAEGYPAAEMKHGPIALIDENMPVVFIAIKDKSHDKIVSNIQEVKARKGRIIAVINEGDDIIKNLADHVIEIPQTMGFLSPLTTVIPLQLLSYHVATMRGCNVDQPRNLAKSVTVE